MIIGNTRTGDVGYGKLFIIDLTNAIRIRIGEDVEIALYVVVNIKSRILILMFI